MVSEVLQNLTQRRFKRWNLRFSDGKNGSLVEVAVSGGQLGRCLGGPPLFLSCLLPVPAHLVQPLLDTCFDEVFVGRGGKQARPGTQTIYQSDQIIFLAFGHANPDLEDVGPLGIGMSGTIFRGGPGGQNP